jgi:hypothetical protein
MVLKSDGYSVELMLWCWRVARVVLESNGCAALE